MELEAESILKTRPLCTLSRTSSPLAEASIILDWAS